MSDFDFLAHVNDWLVRDEDLAAAYEQTGDVRRSWLKKSIAHAFALTGGLPQLSSLTQKTWPDGLTVLYLSFRKHNTFFWNPFFFFGRIFPIR